MAIPAIGVEEELKRVVPMSERSAEKPIVAASSVPSADLKRKSGLGSAAVTKNSANRKSWLACIEELRLRAQTQIVNTEICSEDYPTNTARISDQ